MIAPAPFVEARVTPMAVRGRLETVLKLGYHVDLVVYQVGEKIKIPFITMYATMGTSAISQCSPYYKIRHMNYFYI